MKPVQGLAAALAVAALAGGGAVAAASSNGGGTGTITTTTGTSTTTTTRPAPHGGVPGRGFGGGYDFFDAATKTALQETFAAAQTAQKTATDAGKAPDDIRDAAVAAAKTRLDQAVTDGALTKAQGAAVLAALTKQLGARAAAIDAAACGAEADARGSRQAARGRHAARRHRDDAGRRSAGRVLRDPEGGAGAGRRPLRVRARVPRWRPWLWRSWLRARRLRPPWARSHGSAASDADTAGDAVGGLPRVVSAAVGLSTCVAYSRGQNQSFWLC